MAAEEIGALMFFSIGCGAILIVLVHVKWPGLIKLATNKTNNWDIHSQRTFLLIVGVSFILYSIVLYNPNLHEKLSRIDYGPIDPLIKHFLKKPVH